MKLVAAVVFVLAVIRVVAAIAALRVTKGGAAAELDRSDDPGEANEVEVMKDGREHDVASEAFRPVPNRRYED